MNGALQWLEDNQDKDFEESKAADTTAKETAAEEDSVVPALTDEDANSLVCDECGKKFRSSAQAEFHASKS